MKVLDLIVIAICNNADNLAGAHLQGADLAGANLAGANLEGADLAGANLKGADLEGADLWGAHLRGANLAGAHLRGAHLVGADLRGANLAGAHLQGAHLRGALGIFARVWRIEGGYEFIAIKQNEGYKIKAGCRWFTDVQFREHVQNSYPNTNKAKETIGILDYIASLA